MSDIAKNNLEIQKFNDGTLAELKPHSDHDIVMKGNSIENYRVSKSVNEAAKIFSGYIIQANILLSERQRMPVNQIIHVCKHLLDGVAWDLRFEELSNIITSGINGQYGKLFQLDMPTIGGWIAQYKKSERENIFKDKEHYRNNQRQSELDSMGDNHSKLFREVLKLPKKK